MHWLKTLYFWLWKKPEPRPCPSCGALASFERFFDRWAFHCHECLFERFLEDGTVQHYCVNMGTGRVTWRNADNCACSVKNFPEGRV